ncbi:MAG: hypothetical protein KDC98_09025 [Planctomycetes bacterium]|nr:hypothetical protein [Planctomycetota bacterium]
MIGTALVAIATMEPWSDEALASLPDEARSLLEAGLQRADSQYHARVQLAGELAFMAAYLDQNVGAGFDLPALQGWRYGFSTRWMTADAWLQLHRAADRLNSSNERWSERRRLIEAVVGSEGNAANPVLAIMLPNLVAAECNLRDTLTQLRMLRLAVALHGGRGATLQDPLGDGPLSVTVDGRTSTISSVGKRHDAPLTRTVVRVD